MKKNVGTIEAKESEVYEKNSDMLWKLQKQDKDWQDFKKAYHGEGPHVEAEKEALWQGYLAQKDNAKKQTQIG